MSEPYVGEIRLFGFRFAPVGWLYCDGSLLEINDYQPLFSILGTTYGGDGVTKFGLPDLRARVPVGVGQGIGLPTIALGQTGGAATHTLTTAEMPPHTHVVMATNNTATSASPDSRFWASDAPLNSYSSTVTAGAFMNANALTTAGGSQPHDNMQPTLVGNYCICVYGVFPSPN